MEIEERPIKNIIIYDIVEIPFSTFSKYISGNNVAWVDGFFVVFNLFDKAIHAKAIIDTQIFHVEKLFFCKLDSFPEEFKNMRGEKVQILNANYSEAYRVVADFLKKREKKKEKRKTKNSLI